MDNRSFKSEYKMINYNGKLTPSFSAALEISNRGFQYGDGVFETIIIKNGKIKFFDEHWERLLDGVNTLKLNITFSKSEFFKMIKELLSENNLLQKNVRAKLLVWRRAGGLYMPQQTISEFCLMMHESESKAVQHFSKVEVSDRVQLSFSQWSHLKTISAMPYIMAGMEKKDRELEELILLNQSGFIAEASASNLYFFDHLENKLFTPSLKSGCINGVSRRYLVKNVLKKNIEIEEVMWKISDLNANLSAFTINVAGINCIQNIGHKKMHNSEEGLKMLAKILNY